MFAGAGSGQDTNRTRVALAAGRALQAEDWGQGQRGGVSCCLARRLDLGALVEEVAVDPQDHVGVAPATRS